MNELRTKYTYVEEILVLALLFFKLLNHNYRGLSRHL